jgi:hypothetical protein
VLSIAVVACRGTPATRSGNNVERTALVAQHCPGLDLEAEPLDPTNARVFVEIVEVSRRDLPDPIGHWLDENAVKIRSSANLVAFPGVPTSVPWAQCVDAACADIERSVRVTAQLPASTLQPIELAVQIEETSGEGAAPKNLLDTQVRAIHQEPVVLPSPPVLGTGTLVLTAYLLRRFDDLHRVMECKVQHAERENQSAPQ